MRNENELRQADFAYKDTLVVEGGEIDRYVAGSRLPEIHVRLEPVAEGSLCLGEASFREADGQASTIFGDDGSRLDAESVDMLAHEFIEANIARSLEYSYGRNSCVDEQGILLVVGESFDRSALDEEVIASYDISPDFSFS